MGDSRRTGGEPCGDTEMYSVCLVFLNGADVLCDCHKVWLYKSSGDYSETDITLLLIIGLNDYCDSKMKELDQKHGKVVQVIWVVT